MQNLVVVSHIVCADVGPKMLGDAGPPQPFGCRGVTQQKHATVRGAAIDRRGGAFDRIPLSDTCYHTKFRRYNMSNRLGAGRVIKILGDARAPPLGVV